MKFLDYNEFGYLISRLKEMFIQEEAGKGLSSNDFTNILKDKLDGIETGAEANLVTSINGKIGEVKITGDDIEFLSSVSGATPTTVRAEIDNILSKNKQQDVKIGEIEDSAADTTYVDNKLEGKVDKIQGKGLSTNDFTTAIRSKVSEIEAGAQVNKIELIKRNGTNLSIVGKSIDIEVPTKASQLTNDLNYQTKSDVQTIVSEQDRLKKEIVDVLPNISDVDGNTMYMIRNQQDTGYEEWMTINGEWEILGDTAAVDFTGYIHESDIETITKAEIDAFLNL